MTPENPIDINQRYRLDVGGDGSVTLQDRIPETTITYSSIMQEAISQRVNRLCDPKEEGTVKEININMFTFPISQENAVLVYQVGPEEPKIIVFREMIEKDSLEKSIKISKGTISEKSKFFYLFLDQDIKTALTECSLNSIKKCLKGKLENDNIVNNKVNEKEKPNNCFSALSRDASKKAGREVQRGRGRHKNKKR